jgi:hypothetical protein
MIVAGATARARAAVACSGSRCWIRSGSTSKSETALLKRAAMISLAHRTRTALLRLGRHTGGTEPGGDELVGPALASERVEGKAQAAAVANSHMRTKRSTADAVAQFSPVVEWRRERLLAAGFALGLAALLAEDCAIDLHAALELVDRGCPPELAARILAPLDDRRRPC